MTVAGHVNVNQEGAGNQVKDDAQATQKTEVSLASSSISSDYVAKFLNCDNIPSADTEAISMLDINVQHEVPRTSSLLTIPVSKRHDNTDEPPVVNVDPKDWFKKLERTPTPDPELNEGPDYYILKNTYKSYVELDYNMEECYKALADQLDRYNPKGDRYPFDLRKPLPLVMLGNRQIVLVDYFFNNDLAYFQGVSTSRTYTTSLTKTKASKYDLPGIEDMVHNLVSKHDVCSTKRILAVKNVKVKEWYGYGHLEEIIVRRSDHKLYKFIEGDFPQLHLHDIEDIRIVIHKRVEDLYLGVESYQKMLNISRPMTHKAGITDLKPYFAYSNPQGFIYVNKLGRIRLMCSHELYKFSDGTLISLCDTLKDMVNNLEMGYTSVMPKRRWSNLDKKRSRIMIKDIDRQLLDRRLMRSLEKFVGGREYEEDLRVLQQTI
nr:hypothetical protein [Tanacetum cinerariifolium]